MKNTLQRICFVCALVIGHWSLVISPLAANTPLRNPRISGDTGGVVSGTFTVQSGAELALASGAIFTAAEPISLANGGTGAALTDPGADRLLFWDESAGAVTWLEIGSGLSISGTTLSATGGGGGAPTDATYIVQTPSAGLSAEQALSELGTGLLRNTTGTGVLSIATAGTHFVEPGAITTSGLTMATARLLGRTTASTGAVEEITVGSGLSLSGGTLTATGGGGGGGGGTLSLARWTALGNQPPASGFATFDTRNAIPVLDFIDSGTRTAVFMSLVPEGADLSSGLEVRLVWMATSATSGNVVWSTAFERGNTDLDSDSWGTAVSATGAANATSGIVTTTSVLHSSSEIDGLQVGELFRVRVQRLGADASDTMSGDAELIAVEVRAR